MPGPAHPIVILEVIYPGVPVDCRSSVEPRPPCANSPVERTFSADATVEVRLALGGEHDWDFDWTSFAAAQPLTKADCKKGGWRTFEFANQGQCIRFVNTGKDSR